MSKSGEQAFRVFCFVFVDQPVITRAIWSYPDDTCSDAKVNDDSRRWRNENIKYKIHKVKLMLPVLVWPTPLYVECVTFYSERGCLFGLFTMTLKLGLLSTLSFNLIGCDVC